MKIEVDQQGAIVLKEVYQGFLMETEEGNAISICMRDDTFEINVLPHAAFSNNWWRVNMQTGTISRLGESD